MKLDYLRKFVFGSFLALSALCLHVEDLSACSAAVISGKITPDGRPLLWKHRDTDCLQNSVMYFRGRKFNFVGIVNSGLAHPDAIWMGTNSAGFSIMNTQSLNLEDIENEDDRGVENGTVMYRALEICADVQDFCHFLDTLSKPNGIEANFGIIDAKGGAVMLEVDGEGYTLFDANNPKDAPYGYIARTNFSFTGDLNEGAGFVRYMLVEHEMMPAAASMRLTPEWIFNNLSRSFKNMMLGIDLRSGNFNSPKTRGWFVDNDMISRRESSNAAVIQGVKAGENPDLTVMWTVLGYPPTGVAVPVWVKYADRILPELVRDNKDGVSPVCNWAVTLSDRVYCYNQGSGTDRYFNWDLLHNPAGTGFMQRLAPVEAAVFKMSRPVLKKWQDAGKVNFKEMEMLYGQIQQCVSEGYESTL